MPGPVDHLDTVGEVVEELRALGLEPVLVGGMALVVLGSRRVTRDFDFVIAHPGDRLASTIDLFYDRGLELVSRLNDVGRGDLDDRQPQGRSHPASSRCAGERILLQSKDRPSRRPVVRLPHPGGDARRTCDAHEDSLACLRDRLGAGSPASQEDRQGGAFGAGRRRGHRLSRVPPKALQVRRWRSPNDVGRWAAKWARERQCEVVTSFSTVASHLETLIAALTLPRDAGRALLSRVSRPHALTVGCAVMLEAVFVAVYYVVSGFSRTSAGPPKGGHYSVRENRL